MRLLLVLALAVGLIGPAFAATPAETFVSDNIQKGITILNDGSLSQAQRGAQFEELLLRITDTKRIATYTLGTYAASASQADRDAFADGFERYAVAVYRSYLGKYAGQSLKVTGSRNHAPGDDLVNTVLVDPSSSGRLLEISFRVSTASGAPLIIDFSVAGVWIAQEQHDQFGAYLKQNGGNVPALTAHLDELRGRLAAAQ